MIAEKFTSYNIFNADETRLYRIFPDRAYGVKTGKAGCKTSKERITILCCAKRFPDRAYRIKTGKPGCKTSIERITILCCANMSDDKEKLLVISKRKILRCFKSVKNSSLIFNYWILKWSNKCIKSPNRSFSEQLCCTLCKLSIREFIFCKLFFAN